MRDRFGRVLAYVYVGDTFDSQLRLLSPRAGKSVQTSSGAAGVLALESIVSRGSVKVRYLLSLAAPVTLSLRCNGCRYVWTIAVAAL